MIELSATTAFMLSLALIVHPPFNTCNGRHEQIILNHAMSIQVLFAVEYVEKNAVKHIITSVSWIISYDYAFQLIECRSYLSVLVGIFGNTECSGIRTIQQFVDIGEYVCVFILHVATYLVNVVVEEAQNKNGNIV